MDITAGILRNPEGTCQSLYWLRIYRLWTSFFGVAFSRSKDRGVFNKYIPMNRPERRLR